MIFIKSITFSTEKSYWFLRKFALLFSTTFADPYYKMPGELFKLFKRREIQCESFTLVCTSHACSILTQSSWIRLTLTSLAKLLLQNISSVWRLLMCENECGCRRQAGGEKSTNKHTNIFHMIGCKAFGCVTCENFVLSALNIDVLLSEWKWGWWWW